MAGAGQAGWAGSAKSLIVLKHMRASASFLSFSQMAVQRASQVAGSIQRCKEGSGKGWQGSGEGTGREQARDGTPKANKGYRMDGNGSPVAIAPLEIVEHDMIVSQCTSKHGRC